MMEGNNNRWAAVQADVGEANSPEWRSQLQGEARQRIVNKIMDTLKKHLPISGPEGLGELKKIAVRFEEKIYTAAISQSDYLRKISMKMLTMEQKTQGGGVNGNPLLPTSGAANQNSSDPVNLMQPQVRNQGSSMQVPVTNQPQTRQQLLAQNLQSNISSTTVQGSGLSSITGLTQPNMSSLGQNPNMHAMPVIAQNSVNNTPGQSVPQNIYANSQRQMQGRHQQQSMISQQHQQQPQNQILYQQQLIKQKMQQSSLMQSQIPQQQQPVIQQNQLQSSQQPLIQMSSGLQSNQNPLQHCQPSMIQSVSQSGIQQNQQNSVQQPASSLHQQHPQSLVRQQQPSQQPNLHQQTSSLMQQPTSISQQSAVLPSHQQQIMGHQSNLSNIQQNQLLGQHNNISDLQQQQQLHQHQQHQRLSNQQNGLMSMQQPQQMINQQNISLHQQQQMPPQSSVSGMQQQPSLQAQHQSQILGSTIPASNMQPQNPMHILQHSKAAGQHMQQTSPVLLQLQGQQSQAQSSQQQLMPQLQTQAHLQQQMGLQQMHRLLQAPGSLLQSQITTEQKPQFQSQRVIPEVPSTSVDSTGQTSELVPEWQEEIYQKILSMKEMYYPELHELSQKLGIKLQQQDPLPPPTGSKQVEQLENMKKFKNVLDRMVQMLLTPRNTIPLAMKDKIPMYEKQIINMIANRSRRAVPLQPQSQQQHQHSGGQNLAIPQPPSQVPATDSQLNQISQMSFQATSTPMNSTGMSSMQSGSLPLSTQIGVPTTQQNIMSSLQSGSNIESGNALSSAQKAAMGSLHVGGLGTLQQSSIGAAHQNNVNNLMQNNANPLQRNALQHQVKQEQQQHQHQHQQHQHQQLVMQKRMQQQLIQHRLQQQQPQHHQQLQQQQKQQPNVQLQGSQMQQLHPINEMNELKMRQISSIKPVLFQPPYQIGQRQAYYQQQHKIPTSFPISSPQSIPISSPQISQHSSPQIDQQPLLSSISKSLTPLQSASSPAVDPSSPAPPTLPIEHEKQLSIMSSLSNTGNAGPQQSGPIPPQAQSLVVDTPGISVSSLLDGKTTVTERPLEHLLRVVGSLSPNLLASSASDIGSVVSMIDQIAGSAPGNGSRASIGEDLVAMTKCRMQARNFMSQDGGAATKKMKRHTSAMPLNVVSSAGSVHDSLKRTSIDTSELESTATSRIKRQKMEANHALLEEIRFINQQLIDTSVDVTEEDVDSISSTTEGEGTVVKFTYCAVALCPTLKSQFAAARVSPILPLRLLIPPNYPRCSPILLDKIPVELRNESEDLSVKAKSRFSSSLRGLSSPMPLKEMARTWDVCARTVISEFAQLSGGGTFSSKYGTWENCAGA